MFNYKVKVILSIILLVTATQFFCYADDNPPGDTKIAPRVPVLTVAVLCEDVRYSKIPINQAVVFSSDLGRLVCFTDFEPVYEKTFIFHKYYFKDKFISRVKLTLNPPRWATYSRIQLRETDKGPWRVDITDANGKVLHSIRFSITD